MRRLLLVLALVAVPLASAQGAADVILRYPPQEAVRIGGIGYNAHFVEGSPGDAVNVTMEIRFRGRVNTLESAQVVSVWLHFSDVALIGQANITIPPGASTPLRFTINGTIPDVENGTYALVPTMQSGGWDPDASNNAPPPIPFQIGKGESRSGQVGERVWWGPIGLGIGLLAVAVARIPAVRETGRRWTPRLQAQWLERKADLLEAPAITKRALVLGAIAVAWLIGLAVGRPQPLIHIGQAAAIAAIVALAIAVRQAIRFWRQDKAFDADRILWPSVFTFAGGVAWQQWSGLGFFAWPDPTALPRFVVLGLAMGAIYALIAVGYNLVYGVLKFVNFAHGEVFMWGAFFAWVLAAQYGILAFPVAILVSMVLTAGLGMAMERVAYRPLRDSGRLVPLITAIAMSMLLAALAQFFFGTRSQSYYIPGSTLSGTALRAWLDEPRRVLGATVDNLTFVTIVVAILALGLVHALVRYTRLGQAMRAVADDMEAARTVGIPVDRVVVATFALGSALAAVAGVLFGLRFDLLPTMGVLTGIKAFTAAVIGGIGNVYGAFLGGFIIGLAENVGGQYLDQRFQNVIAFGLLIIFLLVRPRGLIPGPGGGRR